MRGGIRRGTTNADTATDTDTITKETAVGSRRGGRCGGDREAGGGSCTSKWIINIYEQAIEREAAKAQRGREREKQDEGETNV